MRKKLIVGNWKMHFTTHQASLLLHKLSEVVPMHRDTEVVIAPNFIALQSLSLQVNHRQFKLAAQNCDWRDEGAYTGEVSATMLRGLVDYIIVGHSERRNVFQEHHVDTRKKVQAVLRNGIRPILCVGETASERAHNETRHVLHDQVVSGLANVTSNEIENIVIAYEPVWAIGTGKSALPEDVAKAVGYIRHDVSSLYGPSAAAGLRVLYGGSSNAENAASYMEVEGVDGLLPGGASLQADQFAAMVRIAHEQAQHEEGR
jgi:triosephosphate isomerase (TIM)